MKLKFQTLISIGFPTFSKNIINTNWLSVICKLCENLRLYFNVIYYSQSNTDEFHYSALTLGLDEILNFNRILSESDANFLVPEVTPCRAAVSGGDVQSQLRSLTLAFQSLQYLTAMQRYLPIYILVCCLKPLFAFIHMYASVYAGIPQLSITEYVKRTRYINEML